jgi:cytosine deaminase
VAQLALELDFKEPLLCGHCCSLGVQSAAVVAETLELVKQAGLGIVSLPLCNLYLQDRHPHHTPSWRGITRVQEIRARQIPLALASDNCRDPFFAFGDHDVLEVLTQSVRIGHLDHPYGDWCRAVNQTAAQLMGLPHKGQISQGSEADFIIFKARFFSELFSRPQTDRQIVRGGRLQQVVLPEYRELDNLVFPPKNWV